MEYTQFIDRILEAEQNAQAIAAEAADREARLDEELARETERLHAAAMARADERIAAIVKESAAARDQAIRAQEKRRDEALARMESAYEHYGDNWVDTLFHRIVDSRI